MGSYWAATQQRCYTTPFAGFLVMKDLKQKVQWLEAVQKMELGVEPTFSAQVIIAVLYLLLIQPFKRCFMKNSDCLAWYSFLQDVGDLNRALIG